MCLLTASVGASAQPRSSTSYGATTITRLKVPSSPVGKQLRWLLGVPSQLPLSNEVISVHFDKAFLAQVSPSVLNQALESLGPPGSEATLLGLSRVAERSLVALVRIGPSQYTVDLVVDGRGLISGLLFKPAGASVTQTWSQIESHVSSIAPGTSFLAAKLNAAGTCVALKSVSAETPRPLGSMFKLFVLGALANAIREHKVSWSQKVTVTAAIKVGGSGTLQNAPDGTKLTVEQAAVKMISISDNTAADMLLQLVGRTAVENQVRAWSTHASLDIPFLTVSELFALKYHDFPSFADHYLSLNPSQRTRFLATTVDKVQAGGEKGASTPRDIDSIEWFASANDLCRALAGLAALQAEPGLSPLDKVLSTNNGGISLDAKTWPRIWFKGGSEPGVLTLGYLARDNRGQNFAVIVLTEDTKKPVQESAAVELGALDDIAGSFGLMG
jgi:hypothetical protein